MYNVRMPHRLRDKDLDKMMADCAVCGHVKINKHGRYSANGKPRYRCSLLSRARWSGVNIDEIIARFSANRGGCDICGRELPLHLDHCHKTGKGRGLLCVRCNQVLGRVEDDPLLLEAMARYLEN